MRWALKRSIRGPVARFPPATRETRVQFPADAHTHFLFFWGDCSTLSVIIIAVGMLYFALLPIFSPCSVWCCVYVCVMVVCECDLQVFCVVVM